MRWDAIVVGAGCAGLSAATRLSELGFRVLVLESRPILGGRASSFTDRESGETLDNGQHLFLGCYSDTRRFLQRIGTDHLLRFDPSFRARMIGPDGEEGTLRTAHLPAPWHLALALFRYGPLSVRERLATLRVARAVERADHDLASRSAKDWLRSLGQGERAMARLWTPLILATLNIEPERAPADLLAVVLREGFLQSREGSLPGLPRVGLSDLHGEPSRLFLERRGGEVRRNTTVSRLRLANGILQGVELAEGGVEEAKIVICAVPPPAARRLVAGSSTELEAELRQTENLQPSPILSLHVWPDRAPFDEPYVGFWGRPVHWAFRKAKIYDNPSVGHVSAVVSASDEMRGRKRDELTDLVAADLRLAAKDPSLSIRRTVVVHEREATWVPPLARGANGRLVARTALSNFLLAGDWTATGLPCTIEGAVRSGHWAAEIAATRLRPRAQIDLTPAVGYGSSP